MNCVIPGANMKVISRAIQALAKIGEDIYLRPQKDHISLESVNTTTTAYCTFKFHEAFFSSYETSLEDTDSNSPSDKLICKITAKAILGVFKSHGHKDKKPEFCKIEVEHSKSNTITFKFKYKHDVMALKALYLSDGKVVNIVCNNDLKSNQVSAAVPLFTKVLSNFQMGDDDMSLDFSSSKVVMRNYITGDMKSIRGIRSQISVNANEFTTFKIDRETNITFSLKTFRAAIHFAESFNLIVVLNFDVTGKPAILVIKSTTFECNFVMATLRGDDDTQSTMSSILPRQESSKQKRKKNNDLNLTVQDQQALDSINWDNEFEEINSNSRKKGKFDDFIAKLNDDRNRHISKSNNNNVVNEENVVPSSPVNKKIKSIFGRCFEDTFHSTMVDLGDVLAPDSDPDSS